MTTEEIWVPQWAKSHQSFCWLVPLFLVLIIFPFVISEYYILLLGYILIGGLLAQSFNIMFGYMGKLSFGHAAFFGIGAYTVAILNTKTPVPLFLAIPIALLVSAAIGWVVGFFCVRRAGYYFAILTMAFGQLLFVIVHKWYGFTGGDDGIQGIPIPEILESPKVHYYYILLVVSVSMGLIWRILQGPFGYTLRAIRDNSSRTEFSGVNILRCQLVAFIIACAFAGLAGALFAPFNRAVSPGLLDWTKSADPVNMTLIGGQYTFFGPIVGAVIFLTIQTFILDFTIFWPFVIGCIIIPIILFLPGGIVGFFLRHIRKS
jgi:branched-chain amino acid transport system permease protein